MIQDLLASAAAAEVVLTLEPDGRIRFRGKPSPELLAELRAHKAEIADELRRLALAPSATAPATDATDHAGEIVACDREHALLRRLSTGPSAPTSTPRSGACSTTSSTPATCTSPSAFWQQVVQADRRGILSRLVGWLRSLDRAGEDLGAVRALVDSGPAAHVYHDAGQARR